MDRTYPLSEQGIPRANLGMLLPAIWLIGPVGRRATARMSRTQGLVLLVSDPSGFIMPFP